VDAVLFGAKIIKFFEIYGVSARTTVGEREESLSQCGHFSDKGGGVKVFVNLCGRPLWTVP